MANTSVSPTQAAPFGPDQRRPAPGGRFAATALKLALSAAIAWLVLRRVDFGTVWPTLQAASTPAFALAFAAFLLVPLLGGLRWWVTLRGMSGQTGDVPARLAPLTLCFSLGCVAGQVLPALAGDALRATLAARHGQGMVTVVHSVVLERAFMLLALLALCCATAPGFATLAGAPSYALLTFALLAAGAAGLAALAVADRAGPALAALRLPPRLLAAVAALAASTRHLVLSPWAVALMALSLASNLNFTLAAALLARALGIDVPLWAFLAIMPAVTLASTLPISFGGWGVREGALVLLLGLVGVASGPALALSLLFGTFSLACGLPGVVLWALSRPRPQANAPLGNAPLGNAPLASAPLASAPLASAPLASAPKAA